jgi:agmatine deiminase
MAAPFSMPPEWTPHERTLMCWPARADMWGSLLPAAEASHAEVANAIAAFEPVLMAVRPEQAAVARAACSEAVELFEVGLDDSWSRDSGPIVVVDGSGGRAGVDFGFNAWGEKFAPWDEDAAFAARALERLGVERIDATDFILEGGSIAVDGSGALYTTEQCLLHPKRNPSLSREEIGARLVRELGVARVVWLGRGLIEDDDTDGHVDNILAAVSEGHVLLQTVADPADPNYEPAQENLERLRAAGVTVTELELLPRLDWSGPPTVVPYTNFYVCNGAVIVPTADPSTDDEALARIAALYPGREPVGIPGATLAKGGGGIHCITQQIPTP